MQFILSRVRKSRALLSLLAATSVLTACAGGGGGGAPLPVVIPPPPPPPPPPEAEFETVEYLSQHGLGMMNVAHAFAAGAFGDGITVAVIDSGVDDSFSELAGQVSPNSVSIHEEFGGTLGNYSRMHGTLIAAVIAARRNDAGTHGVAPEATILDIRVDQGVENPNIPGSTFPLYTETDFARSIDYAVDNGAQIISLSIARPPSAYEHGGTMIYDALRRAVDAGIIITIGSANYPDGVPLEDRIVGDFLPADFADDPAMRGQIVVVPALSDDFTITDFSARAGVLADFAISAPGEDIFVFLDDANTGSVRGVSFAGPHVAGALALLMSAFPNLTGPEALQILYDSARDLGADGVDDVYGHGIPDMQRAFMPQGQAAMRVANGAQKAELAMVSAEPAGAFGDWAWESELFDDAILLDRYDRAFSVRGLLSQRQPRVSGLRALEHAASTGLTPVRHSAIGHHGSVMLRQAADAPRIFSQLDAEMGVAAPSAAFEIRQGNLSFAGGRGLMAPSSQSGRTSSVLTATSFAGAANAFAMQSSWSQLSYDLDGWTLGIRSSGDADAGFRSASLMRALGVHEVGFELGTTAETDRALGGQVGSRLGLSDASQTDYQAALWRGDLPGGWSGRARFELAQTRLQLADGVNLVETPTSSAWSLAFERAIGGGFFGLTVNQPLRAETGAISTSIATGVDENRNLVYTERTGALTPSGREVSAEASLRWTSFGDADLTLATRLTRQPGHMAHAPTDLSVWFGLRSSY